MTTNDGMRPFIEKVANETREYIHSILDENSRLVSSVTVDPRRWFSSRIDWMYSRVSLAIFSMNGLWPSVVVMAFSFNWRP